MPTWLSWAPAVITTTAMISPVAQVVVLTPGMQGLSLASEMLGAPLRDDQG